MNFFSLTLLNPGIGMIYAHKNHPYYPKWQKWTLSGFLGLIDLPYLYLALKNENSEDFNTGIMGILLWRLAGGFIGAIDIRNFNDVIESGYYFGDLYFSKNQIEFVLYIHIIFNQKLLVNLRDIIKSEKWIVNSEK